jgi:hypothetical protein
MDERRSDGATATPREHYRCSVSIETMSKGPAKVTVRVEHEESGQAGEEALRLYRQLVAEVKAMAEPDS